MKHSSHFGPLMMVSAALMFSLGGILCKLIPWSPLSINGVRSVFSLIPFILFIKLSHHEFKLNKTVIIGSVCMFFVTTLFIVANKMTTAANAIILQYTAPVWIILFMALLFHVMPTKLDIATCAVVFAGIICFFLDSIGGGNMLGNVIAILSGIAYAGLFMLNQFEDGDALSSMVIGQVIASVLLSPCVLSETDFSPKTIFVVFVLGIVQVALGYICFSIGTKYTPPVSASLITFLEPILNPIWVAIFWGELLSPLSLVGAAIVLAAILCYNVVGSLRASKEAAAQ